MSCSRRVRGEIVDGGGVVVIGSEGEVGEEVSEMVPIIVT